MNAAQRRRKHSPSSEVIPKMPRLESPQFRHGAIRRILLHDFLTFNDVAINPSPQLNVIVGPNGTGKSSLVCAICLGLGGRTGLLGRAKFLKDFVKHGSAKEASIEITLHHRSGNHPIIRREIKKESSTSKWFLNGRDRQEGEIQDFIKKHFDIQLENKCQFLPQDKVVEFAKLDSYQLLEETEKAIGQDNMYELHQKLKGLKHEKNDLMKSEEDLNNDLEKLRRENSLLERDVTRLRTREDCLKRIKHLKWKKYWLDYEDARNTYNIAKVKRKDADKERRDLHKQYQPLIEKLDEKVKIVKSFQESEEKCRREVNDIVKLINTKHGQLVELQDEQGTVVKEYNDKIVEENEQKHKISELQEQIESLKKDLNDLPTPESVKPQWAAINKEFQVIRQEMARIQDQQLPLVEDKQQLEKEIEAAETRLKEIMDVYNQRIMKLRERDSHTVRAIEWLEANRSMFTAPIHNPVIVLLQIKNMRYAPQVEDFFMGKDAYSFVCESSEDYTLFTREVCDKLNMKVNVVVAPEKPLDQYKPSIPLKNMTQYGFKHMLMDLVEAPSAVLAYFCQVHHLHEVPIADSSNVERFTRALPTVQKFYVSSDVYIAKQSRYTGQTITRSNHIRPCQFFLSSINEVEKATLHSDITEFRTRISSIDKQCVKLKADEDKLRKADRTARERKTALKESVNAGLRSKRTLDSREIQLKRYRDNPIDLEQEKINYEAKLRDIFKKKSTLLTKITEHVKIYKAVLLRRTRTSIDLAEADLRKKHYDSEKESVTVLLKQADEVLENVRVEVETSKKLAFEKLKLAQNKTGFQSPEELARSGFKAVFDDLPFDAQAIEENIHELQTQADLCGSTLHGGENIIQQYEERKAEIDRKKAELDRVDDNLKAHMEKTKQLEEQWLQPLEKMMEDVNKRFGNFFKMMKCCGEVSLAKHKDDYSKFGVQIRVKFRPEEDLQLLTAQRQSGGERSVSTMMYLMSLQDITSCPFRVVDEINQGMDSANERRVFNLIVDTVKQKDTSQYFMLTPKLLQGLTYSDSVTVHAVHNGPELMPYNHWPS